MLFTDEIAVANRIHAVLGHRSKPQNLRQLFSVNVEGVASDCPRTEWHDVNTICKLLQTIAVRLQEEAVGEKPVTE